MPDYSSDLFFLFLQTTILTLKGPLFLQFLQSYNSYLANLKYWRKSLWSSIFTSSKKLKGTKGYCLRVFSALWDFFFEKKNSPKGPPFNFLEFSDRTDCFLWVFRHCETFFQKIFFHQKCPSFNFFWYATEWMKNLKVSPLVRQFGSTFGFFRYRRREYFDTLKSFCCFWALDMAPTRAVPGLFFLTTILTLIGPQTILKPPEAKSGQGRLSPKGPPFHFHFFKETYNPLDFFRHCDFFEKVFNVPKRSPLRVFSYFATECMLIHPFYIFRHCATFFERIFFQKLQVFFQKNVFALFEP